MHTGLWSWEQFGQPAYKALWHKKKRAEAVTWLNQSDKKSEFIKEWIM